jgi:hypothetical protein
MGGKRRQETGAGIREKGERRREAAGKIGKS